MTRRAVSNSIIFLALALLTLLGGSSAVCAAEQTRLEDPFEITADRIDYDGRRDLYIATGRVNVVQAGRSLQADWVAFSTATRIGVAEGDVLLLDGKDRLDAAFMVFDVDSLRGMLFQGGLDSGSEGFRIRAGELVRTGENTFSVTDGVFSSCRCEPGERLPWQISAAEGNVELGGYGTLRNGTFDVLGVPVLWIPWIFFPVKSDRETGFLLPDIVLGGRGGAGGGLPFFWAAHEQLNVIATPNYLSRRGYKQNLQLEYVFGERSEGDLFVAGAQDKYDEPSGATQEARWAVLWRHDQFLPAKWRWVTDLNLVSDNLYADDYPDLPGLRANRFLESTTWLGRGFGQSDQFGVMAASRYADDQQGLRVRRDEDPTDFVRGPIDYDFQDGDDTILQRFIELRGDVQPGGVDAPWGLDPRFDFEAIQFGALRRHESVFRGQGDPTSNDFGHFQDVGRNGFFSTDQPGQPAVDPTDIGEGDGIFEPGERIAERGSRVIFHPRLARAFRVGDWVDVEPELGWSQTLYHTDQTEYAQRGMVTARLELNTRFARDFARTGRRSMRHVIEPRLGWALLSKQFQGSTPNFVPRPSVPQLRFRALSLENITRDPSDRLKNQNRLVLGLGQRFYDRRSRGVTRLRAELDTAIDWDFQEKSLGQIFAEGRLFYVGPANARLAGAFDPEAAEFKEGEVELNLRHRFRGGIVRAITTGAAYRYQQRIPTFLETDRGLQRSGNRPSQERVNQINVYARIELWQRFRLSYRTIYSFVEGSDGGTITSRGTFEYASRCRCWAAGVTIAQRRRDGVSAGIQIRFMGLGDQRGGLFDGGFGTGVSVF